MRSKTASATLDRARQEPDPVDHAPDGEEPEYISSTPHAGQVRHPKNAEIDLRSLRRSDAGSKLGAMIISSLAAVLTRPDFTSAEYRRGELDLPVLSRGERG
ncbi:hypothetical protein [Amycolatopsis sp. NPDC059657]|uniref:hypothetical protein n=1 Tax=Amycolatopsis sp. NPDC059657 TaxID=3346899 RepID=UPI0036703509